MCPCIEAVNTGFWCQRRLPRLDCAGDTWLGLDGRHVPRKHGDPSEGSQTAGRTRDLEDRQLSAIERVYVKVWPALGTQTVEKLVARGVSLAFGARKGRRVRIQLAIFAQ